MHQVLKHKFIHINKNYSGWSFGICFTNDSYLDETYLFINFFKWNIAIGKLAYLKTINEEE